MKCQKTFRVRYGLLIKTHLIIMIIIRQIELIIFTCFWLLQSNLTELKSFGSPVAAVTNVTAAVMVLMAPGGRIPKDRSWKAAKVMMAKVDAFLDALINFDKENIPETCLKAIQPYLQVSFLLQFLLMNINLYTACSTCYLTIWRDKSETWKGCDHTIHWG